MWEILAATLTDESSAGSLPLMEDLISLQFERPPCCLSSPVLDSLGEQKKLLCDQGSINSKNGVFNSPLAKCAGLKGLRAESAGAVTGRRCPHSGEGEDFFTGQLIFLR